MGYVSPQTGASPSPRLGRLVSESTPPAVAARLAPYAEGVIPKPHVFSSGARAYPELAEGDLSRLHSRPESN
jgi:hypothetical protein